MLRFVSSWTTALLFAFLEHADVEVTTRSEVKTAGWLVLWHSFVVTLLSRAHINFSFSLTFSISSIFAFKRKKKKSWEKSVPEIRLCTGLFPISFFGSVLIQAQPCLTLFSIRQ